MRQDTYSSKIIYIIIFKPMGRPVHTFEFKSKKRNFTVEKASTVFQKRFFVNKKLFFDSLNFFFLHFELFEFWHHNQLFEEFWT